MRLPPSSARVLGPALLAVLLTAGLARAEGSADTAALQVALRERSLYVGDVDGYFGPVTLDAVQAFQRRRGLPVTGYVGPLTRGALGPYARRTIGTRALRFGKVGWDVAALQFQLAWHGFPSGVFDGVFGSRTRLAVVGYERWLGLFPDAIAGPAVFTGLRSPPPRSPLTLAWPLPFPVGDAFGPRGDRFHAGMDILSPTGVPVAAARSGRVVYAGPHEGGWGIEVTIAHGAGVRTIYAHLSATAVSVGDRVDGGAMIGRVGSTGDATGPHLHFEVRVRGAAVDPMGALPQEG
jgi:peptidoglycan hydrolase-like protein with peptidoglycan-binding domain